MFRFERSTLSELTAHAFVEARVVRFQDVDAAGIIFYPRIFEYCHDVLVSFMAAAGTPLHVALASPRWIAPIRHAEADYVKPLRFGDAIDVALVRAHLEPSEVTLGFRVARAGGGEVCAVVQSVHTFLDPASFRRCELPEPLRGAFAALGA